MKALKWMSSAVLMSLLVSSCFIDIDDDDGLFGCVDGDGPVVSEEVNMDEFDGIRLKGSMDVFIQQGDEQKVVIEGKQNLIDELNYEVNGGIWDIDFDDCVRDVDNFDVYITLPLLRTVQVQGSGNVIGENRFVIGDLEIKITGSGDVSLEAEADDMNVYISGSGDLELEGVADDVKYRIDGSGDVRAFGLECQTADIDVSGSGDLEVWVLELLRVHIDGSGDVYYKGNPTLDVTIDGSGDVIDKN
jgi:hypothetical protein